MALDAGALLQGLEQARGLVVAVSGGPDSTALMHLAAVWRRARSVPVWVATVDHGLRAGSDAVARQVCAASKSLGLSATILPWVDPKPATALQENARHARYGLLARFAAEVGASHLVTAHTRDDQAETVLMRLAAGSGVAGLGGMRPTAALGDLILARPLLGITKPALVAYCVAHNLNFVDDPANGEPRFARARWRTLAAALEAEGLTARRLARLAERAARADAALASIAGAVAMRCEREIAADGCAFDSTALFAEPDELVLRVLGSALAEHGAQRPLRLHRLERLVATLRQRFHAGQAVCRTLHGCVVDLTPARVSIRREPPRRQ